MEFDNYFIKKSKSEFSKVKMMNLKWDYQEAVNSLENSFKKGEINLNELFILKHYISNFYNKQQVAIFIEDRFNQISESQFEKMAKHLR